MANLAPASRVARISSSHPAGRGPGVGEALPAAEHSLAVHGSGQRRHAARQGVRAAPRSHHRAQQLLRDHRGEQGWRRWRHGHLRADRGQGTGTYNTYNFTVQGAGDQGQPLYQAYQITVDPNQPLTVTLAADGYQRGNHHFHHAGHRLRRSAGHPAISLTVDPPLPISTTPLATGTVGVPYSRDLIAQGGTPPYSWFVVTNINELPPGLTLGTTAPDFNNVLTGTPTQVGTFSFPMQVQDSQGQHGERDGDYHHRSVAPSDGRRRHPADIVGVPGYGAGRLLVGAGPDGLSPVIRSKSAYTCSSAATCSLALGIVCPDVSGWPRGRSRSRCGDRQRAGWRSGPAGGPDRRWHRGRRGAAGRPGR